MAVSSTTYQLDSEQAANATTVAAVGKRLGLADHAVTIAIAAALQESGLHNLAHGDRDSLGLFQQRPSQGWGTPSAILTPRLAAAAFYRRLASVAGWQNLTVTAAAQHVQQSAAPNAYADWEAEARDIARALTGEARAGLTCRFPNPSAAAPRRVVDQAVSVELGSPGARTTVTPARGWTVASWLVGHARQLHISVVDFAGRRWTPATGAWKLSATSSSQVSYA